MTQTISVQSNKNTGYFKPRGKKLEFNASTANNSSNTTTRSGTPDSKYSDDIPSYTNQKQGYLIDVKPKSKVFKSTEDKKAFVQEYKMKFKTELCKNFELRGFCKFGDTCSFAHGKHELQQKKHLHEKYKTRLCKDFHETGYCSYGQRCQYLHKETLGVNIFCNFAANSVADAERTKQTYEVLDEIWKMSNSNIRVEKILDKIPERKRLPVFCSIVSSA